MDETKSLSPDEFNNMDVNLNARSEKDVEQSKHKIIEAVRSGALSKLEAAIAIFKLKGKKSTYSDGRETKPKKY